MNSNRGAVLPWLVIIGAIVIILVGFWGWRNIVGISLDSPVATARPELQAEEPPVVLSIAAVTRDSNVFLDKTLSLRGNLSEWVTDRSFIISDNPGGWFSAGSESGILVLSSTPFDVPLNTPDDQIALGLKPQVFVRGSLQVFNTEEFANRFNLRDEDRNELESFDGQAVMVAQMIQKE